MTVTADPDLTRELDRRVALLRRYFDLSTLDGAGDNPSKIRKYYEDSRIGYRFVHSSEGAMHMALNPEGVFDRSGYEYQAKLVEERFPAQARNVLELASGNGFNLGVLAPRHPKIQFLGIDLIESQVKRGNAALAALPNARTSVGDFQRLQLPDATYDTIFVVESFCHATDLPRAFAEAKRVLAPGGRFIVIDAWRAPGFDEQPANIKAAAADIERAMAVADAQQLPVWKDIAAEAGFEVSEDLDLTELIKPNIERLARIAENRMLTHPLRARLLKLFLPQALVTNAVSGYLMPLTVAAGAHTYRLVMLEHA